MARRVMPKPRASGIIAARGDDAFAAGDVLAAMMAYEKATAADPRNLAVRLKLADTQWANGFRDECAFTLTRALRLAPDNAAAARKLSALLQEHRVERPGDLDPFGLAAMFAHTHVEHEGAGWAALDHLAASADFAGPLRLASDEGRGDALARELVLRRTHKILTAPLLHAALANSANHRPDFEALLTRIRRVLLLELPGERLADRALMSFLEALIRQCWNNGHVLAVASGEEAALARLPIPWERLKPAAVSPEFVRALLLNLLYRPFAEVAGEAPSAEELAGLRPKSLGAMLAERIAEHNAWREAAAAVPALPLPGDGVTQAVARHYEAWPYPQWRGIHLPEPASARFVLARFFEPGSLAFLDGPHNVLIAGAGTGHHALCSALRYGPNARVLAIDLSRASLGHASLMGRRLGVTNIEFLRADLKEAAALPGTFHVIEAMGVLHHLRDPFAAWRALLGKLHPGGLMWVGLYSTRSREAIALLRASPDFPGPLATDAEVRAWRAGLLRDPESALARRLRRSYELYSLEGFRDLVLNPQETGLDLPRIEAFLKENRLRFAGFVIDPGVWRQFRERFPGDPWPGQLSRWHALEQERPELFDAMYQFWCSAGHGAAAGDGSKAASR